DVDRLHAHPLLRKLRDNRLHRLAKLAPLRREIEQRRFSRWRKAWRAGENGRQDERRNRVHASLHGSARRKAWPVGHREPRVSAVASLPLGFGLDPSRRSKAAIVNRGPSFPRDAALECAICSGFEKLTRAIRQAS